MQRKRSGIIHHGGSQVDLLQTAIDSMNKDLEKNRVRMRDLQMANDDLIRNNEALSETTSMLRRNTDFIKLENEGIQQQLPDMKKKEDMLARKINILLDKIQRDSYRDAYER